MDQEREVCLYKAPGNARKIQITDLTNARRNERFPVYMVDDNIPFHSLYVFVMSHESPVQGYWLFKKYHAFRIVGMGQVGDMIPESGSIVGFSHNTDETQIKEDFDSCVRMLASETARQMKAELIDETTRCDEGHLAQIAS